MNTSSVQDTRFAAIYAAAKGRNVLITTHENPDGDAFGSLLGLGFVLKDQCASVQLYVDQDTVNDEFSFLPGWNEITNTLPREGPDLVIIVDCNMPERVSQRFADWLPAHCSTLAVLDHHMYSGRDSELFWIDPQAASACSVVAGFADCNQIRLSQESASCLYTGLATDTGFFAHRNTSAQVFELAAVLVGHGADPSAISEALQSTLTENRLRLLRLALDTLQTGVTEKGVFWGSMIITHALLAEAGASEKDTGFLIEYVRHLKGVKVAFVVRQKDEQTSKVSMRCHPPYSVQAIVAKHGGGGHKYAAGVTLACAPEPAHALILNEVASLD